MLIISSETGPPLPCGYLPDRRSQYRYDYVLTAEPDEYEERMNQGWRRFGHTLFRPECQTCQMCKAIRVDATAFQPDRSQQRIWKKNQADIRLQINTPSATPEKIKLYNTYHAFRRDTVGWNHRTTSTMDYQSSFVDNPFPSEEWCYYIEDLLVGVGYVDAVPKGLSAIYFFYEPMYHNRSLGTYNILNVIQECRVRSLPYTYLGYYIEGCRSSEYKKKFRPNSLLDHSTRQWSLFQSL